MAGEGRLDCDFSRFEVSDFADQNDVGVLAQEGTEGGSKIQPDLVLHLHLVDATQLKLDRIFRCHDIRVRRVQAGHRRIKRIGFARSCWARDKYHAVGPQDRFLELSQGFLLKPQFRHVQAEIFLSSKRMKIFSPKNVGTRENAKSKSL